MSDLEMMLEQVYQGTSKRRERSTLAVEYETYFQITIFIGKIMKSDHRVCNFSFRLLDKATLGLLECREDTPKNINSLAV